MHGFTEHGVAQFRPLARTSNNMNSIIDILQKLNELPYITACVAAIVVAFALHRRAPYVTVYVVVACGLPLLLLLLHPLALQVAPLMIKSNSAPDTMLWINAAFAVLWSVASAISIGLLVVAVYRRRRSE